MVGGGSSSAGRRSAHDSDCDLGRGVGHVLMFTDFDVHGPSHRTYLIVDMYLIVISMFMDDDSTSMNIRGIKFWAASAAPQRSACMGAATRAAQQQ